MIRLTRTIRFAINPADPPRPTDPLGPIDPPGPTDPAGSPRPSLAHDHTDPNGFGGRPALRGLGRFYEAEIACIGTPDAGSGYLINIKAIDKAFHESVIPRIAGLCHHAPHTDPIEAIAGLTPPLAAALAPVRLAGWAWRLTPTFAVEIDTMTPTPTHTHRVLIRQRFDLAAAHRLHDPTRSDDDNRRLFGKCNNPAGHGHNYTIEPRVEVTPGAGFGLPELEALTELHLIEPFDHKHLNHDTQEFNTHSGLNPSVEHIARVFFDRLCGPVQASGRGARLVSLTVWETDRTSATYPA